jgi:hypothetical protein
MNYQDDINSDSHDCFRSAIASSAASIRRSHVQEKVSGQKFTE